MLELLDIASGQWRTLCPEKACKQRGFYSVELPGADPEVVETGVLQELETNVAPVLRKVSRMCTERPTEWPSITNGEYATLVAFIALLYLRSAPRRRRGKELADRLLKEHLRALVSDADECRSLIARAQKDGALDPDFSYEELKEFSERDQFTADFDQTFHVGAMLGSWRDVGAVLADRPASFLVGGGQAGLLVASDDPVSVYLKGDHDNFDVYQTDLRDDRTGLLVALSPEVALRIDAELPPACRRLTKREVARINTSSALPGRTLVVAATRTFTWLDRGDTLSTAEDLVKRFSEIEREFAALANKEDSRRVAELLKKISRRPRKNT